MAKPADYWVGVREDGPGYKVELFLGATAASWLWIGKQVWRVGTVPVLTGGIGGVGTLKEHRNKGYSTACMVRAVEFMKEKRFPISALFGIPNFYPRWGYTSMMAEPRLTISVKSALETERVRGQRVVPFNRDKHSVEALKIYEAANRERSGSKVRPPAKWWRPFSIGSFWGIRTDSFAVVDRRGRLLGYAAHDKVGREVFNVVEVGARGPEAYGAITAELASRAKRGKYGQMTMFLPFDDHYATWLQRWTMNQSLQYYQHADGMARIIDLEETFRVCAPELSRRLVNSGCNRTRAALTFATDTGKATLLISGGKVRVAREAKLPERRHSMTAKMPQTILTRLLFGYGDPDATASGEGVSVPVKARPLLRALFPRGYPYNWPADRF
jgi:GNAT superfamily N-acetyltransferase